MLDAALASGVATDRAVFEVFARGLPPGRRFGVVAGLGRLIEALEEFRFGSPELEWLAENKVVSSPTLEWLAAYRFSGNVDAYLEGETYFPNSPVLTVEASFGEAVLLETLVLSILNFDTAIASAAARMVLAAGGRTLVEMGSRRVHERAAVAAARAAVLAGFDSTSNLEAGRRYDLRTAGTAAHAFTLAHRDEKTAFGAQLDALGLSTTLLVDTYQVQAGIEAAVAAARERGASGPGAIRIDSGDLAELAREARQQLDRLGATETKIVASSDLDEWALASLADAPVDSYGVGTRLVTGSGAPTAGFIYKLVAVGDGATGELRPVAKASEQKATQGGRKWAWRLLDAKRAATGELLLRGAEPPSADLVPNGGSARPLQRRVIDGGRPTPEADASTDLVAGRRRLERALGELDEGALRLDPGEPALTARLG
ncbi:MAG: nicotinate phosphoribosyltransferase [Acidimicrobiaceae bacterium]|nr:nicotinate phosphoribosyltransferase [Acidimicrobiaceae bacterium]